MPALILVRHGQALDALAGDYDGLSELGVEQARRIGAALAGVRIARAYAGPRKRQRLTGEHALPAKELTFLDALDEHRGHFVVEHLAAHPELATPEVRAALNAADASRGGMARVVAAVVRAWARGDLQAPVDESFAAFRARVSSTLSTLAAGLEGSDAAIAFTSGGFIGAAVGHALGVAPEVAVELGLQVDNASFTELRFSRREPDRFVLKRFNGVAHLAGLVSGI